jgi:hypothetical protein
MQIRAEDNLRIVMRRRPAPLTSVATARPGRNWPAAQTPPPSRAGCGSAEVTKSCQDTF